VQAGLRHTRRPFELILVDNGSTDGTGVYLAGIVDAAPVPVTVITNPTNLGCPVAINQGLKAARGEYHVFLNNDAVVTDGWLDQLIALAEMKRGFHKEGQEVQEGKTQEIAVKCRIGLVGPMSNDAAPPQLVGNVPTQTSRRCTSLRASGAKSTARSGSPSRSSRGFACS
jgi:glycosyltransferase involved in cell wall biosynthesis